MFPLFAFQTAKYIEKIVFIGDYCTSKFGTWHSKFSELSLAESLLPK
jgi:hypothetical protein